MVQLPLSSKPIEESESPDILLAGPNRDKEIESICKLLEHLAGVGIPAAKYNLTSSQVFHLLTIPFDGIAMSILASKLGLDNSTLTRNIQKLEKLTLVTRISDDYDSRISKVVLTEGGVALVKLLDSSLEDYNYNVLEQIDLETQEHLITVLEKLSWALISTRENL